MQARKFITLRRWLAGALFVVGKLLRIAFVVRHTEDEAREIGPHDRRIGAVLRPVLPLPRQTR